MNEYNVNEYRETNVGDAENGTTVGGGTLDDMRNSLGTFVNNKTNKVDKLVGVLPTVVQKKVPPKAHDLSFIHTDFDMVLGTFGVLSIYNKPKSKPIPNNSSGSEDESGSEDSNNFVFQVDSTNSGNVTKEAKVKFTETLTKLNFISTLVRLDVRYKSYTDFNDLINQVVIDGEGDNVIRIVNEQLTINTIMPRTFTAINTKNADVDFDAVKYGSNNPEYNRNLRPIDEPTADTTTGGASGASGLEKVGTATETSFTDASNLLITPFTILYDIILDDTKVALTADNKIASGDITPKSSAFKFVIRYNLTEISKFLKNCLETDGKVKDRKVSRIQSDLIDKLKKPFNKEFLKAYEGFVIQLGETDDEQGRKAKADAEKKAGEVKNEEEKEDESPLPFPQPFPPPVPAAEEAAKKNAKELADRQQKLNQALAGENSQDAAVKNILSARRLQQEQQSIITELKKNTTGTTAQKSENQVSINVAAVTELNMTKKLNELLDNWQGIGNPDAQGVRGGKSKTLKRKQQTNNKSQRRFAYGGRKAYDQRKKQRQQN